MAGVGLAAMIGSIETSEAEPAMYSRLSSNKMQPPREGCFASLFKEPGVTESSIFAKNSKKESPKQKCE